MKGQWQRVLFSVLFLAAFAASVGLTKPKTAPADKSEELEWIKSHTNRNKSRILPVATMCPAVSRIPNDSLLLLCRGRNLLRARQQICVARESVSSAEITSYKPTRRC